MTLDWYGVVTVAWRRLQSLRGTHTEKTFILTDKRKVKNMAKSSILDTPIGNNKPYLVKCDGNPFIGFDTREQAESYVKMQKDSVKGGKQPTYASLRNWTIEKR